MIKEVLYGGDYNPDQWDENTWEEDIRQLKHHKINTVTLPVFSWANIQKSEDEFNFEWLDKIIALLTENKINFIMATPTAAQPAWMSKKYPDILPVDKLGRKRQHGGRVNFCPNSENYRKFTRQISGKMAERYKDEKGLILWHVNNEMGSYCYCDNCGKAFRKWLKNKYKTIENLNKCWYTNFWGHTYYDWDEINTVSTLNEILPNALGDRDGTNFQSMAIDYHRFMSESILQCFLNEKNEILKYTPEIKVTTNIWGIAPQLDLFKWGKEMDIASWDNYPNNYDSPSCIAFRHDVIRGLKNGDPFILMEQTPNQQNWQRYNATKRPGVMRLISYQAMAHGADGILFFQMKQSRGACEKYHAAVIPHANTENTRIGKELTNLGKELEKLKEVIGGRINSKVALIMDWNSWWGVDYSSGPSMDLKYVDQLMKYYDAIYKLNIPVDIISPEMALDKYDVVLAPTFYMVDDKAKNNINNYVLNGGIFITNFMSGLVDENDQVIMDGYPGAFKDILGILVEETDALYPDMKNKVIIEKGNLKGEYSCGLICDVINSYSAEVIGTYGEDYYKGAAAITKNKFGKGFAYYIGTELYDDLLSSLINEVCKDNGIHSKINPVKDIEVTIRENENGKYMFILNHSNEEKIVSLSEDKFINVLNGHDICEQVVIKGKDVIILKQVN